MRLAPENPENLLADLELLLKLQTPSKSMAYANAKSKHTRPDGIIFQRRATPPLRLRCILKIPLNRCEPGIADRNR